MSSETNLQFSVAKRLRAAIDHLAVAACHDLGLPVTFVREQISYAAEAIETIPSSPLRGPVAGAAFLFPSNTEGAMPAYLITLAASMGFEVEAKLSRRSGRISHAVEAIFRGLTSIRFHHDSGPEFLKNMLMDAQVRFIQAFGDDGWIAGYRDSVEAARKTFAFDGPGKDPLLVLPGADMKAAVDAAVRIGLFAGGAACMSAERFIVHEDIAAEFLELLVARLRGLHPVAPDDPAAVLGYLYSERAAVRLEEQLAQALLRGARPLLAGGITPVTFAGRTFYACDPVVLSDVPADAALMQNETFGPVFPVVTFRTPAEGIRIADNTRYGLTATVFGGRDVADSVAASLRRTHAVTYINQTMLDAFRPEYWGSGGFKNSGWIWEFDEYGEMQTRHGFRPLRIELERVIRRRAGDTS